MITVDIPGSKSIAARALVCRLLGGHDTVLGNLPDCGDTRGMLRLSDGVRKSLASGECVTVDIGEGGTTLRFGMAACASISGIDVVLTGSRRLMERPHTILIKALHAMGADITVLPDGCGIRIKGQRLSGGVIDMDGSISSQYVSALMLAAPEWGKDTVIRLKGKVVSRPYIEMTAGVMRAFGAGVDTADADDGVEVRVKAAGYAQCARYDIEGDWSGASYFFELKLIMEALGMSVPEFEMPALRSPSESLQGDSRVAEIFGEATGCIRRGEKGEIVINLSEAPDLVPAVAVGFCVARLPFRFEGIGHLRHKETDRMAALTAELGRLGFMIETGEESMSWDGRRKESEESPMIRTYKDHRMAMAFAPAQLAYPGLTLEDPDVVDKSFPEYFKEISKVLKSDN